MAFDAYATCPCGSGKKFKWCCQQIFAQMEKAFLQETEGQHEAALRSMEQVVAQHPGNAEAWGRKAELLARNGRLEEAEADLQKAFALNPNYPFGHILRGSFRMEEGEIEGALLLFRKATDLYDPAISAELVHAYVMIADCELKLNRPVAAQAALRIAAHLDPSSEDLRNGLEGYFGAKSRLPLAAKREYTLQPAPPSPGDRGGRSGWEQTLARASTGKLNDAVAAFAELVKSDPDNAAAWYNLAVLWSWRGENRAALDALDRYLNLESDAERAAGAWALGEALRQGHGMEEQSDYLEHSLLYRIAEPQQLANCLRAWREQRRLMVIEAREDAPVFSALVLEQPTALTEELARARLPRLGAYLLIVQDRLRLWHTNAESLARVRQDLQQQAGAALADARETTETASFADVLSAAIVFPIDVPEAERQPRVREEFQRYFEETWIHQPRRSLGSVPPIDAAGHPVLKKKLAGVIQFIEQTAAITAQPYEFDRLRRKLGLLAGAPAETKPAGPDISSLATAELAGLAVEALSDEQLEQAYQAAIKLDAREVAGKFARTLVARPPQPRRPDRFPFYSYLVQLALAQGDINGALDLVNEGEKVDGEQNEGKRRHEYELRRGQIHLKRGEADQAQDVFDRLIERAPGELKFRGSAAEAMLSARQGSRALRFAEAGLKKARELNNRDSEQHFCELIEAAKRQDKG